MAVIEDAAKNGLASGKIPTETEAFVPGAWHQLVGIGNAEVEGQVNNRRYTGMADEITFDGSKGLYALRAHGRQNARLNGIGTCNLIGRWIEFNPELKTAVLALDTASRTVTREGQRIQLTAREYALLHALMQRPGTLLSRAQLEARIYGWGDSVESNAIEFLLHGLRQKIGGEQIENVRGIGWRVATSP